MRNGNWIIHVVALIVHAVIIVAVVIGICILASVHQLTGDALGTLGTLGGGTVVSLGINGRKVPDPPNNERSN